MRKKITIYCIGGEKTNKKLKHKRYMSKAKEFTRLLNKMRDLEELLQQEQARSDDKSRHINAMIAERNEQQKVVEHLQQLNEKYFKWFRIEEERRIALEQQLEAAKKNIKVTTLGLYLLGLLIIIMNIGK